MRAIRMQVSLDYLAERLGMPECMEIVGVIRDVSNDPSASTFIDARQDQMIELVVKHPALEDHVTLAQMPKAAPTMTRHEASLEWKLGDVSLGDARAGWRSL